MRGDLKRDHLANGVADIWAKEGAACSLAVQDAQWRATTLAAQAAQVKKVARYIAHFRVAFKDAGLAQTTLPPRTGRRGGQRAQGRRRMGVSKAACLKRWRKGKRRINALVPVLAKLETAAAVWQAHAGRASPLAMPEHANGHCLCIAGPLAFCAVCGSYADHRCLMLTKACPKTCKKGSTTAPTRLLDGVHPRTKASLKDAPRLASLDELKELFGVGRLVQPA